ncbi:MAG: hypothetical protein LBF62_06340 [Tannerellaceae bacterium]|nr:hypothetical protein [Tannerellaceae bacterium]
MAQPAQGIAAESPDDDRREEEDLQRKARPPAPQGAGGCAQAPGLWNWRAK